MITSFEWIGKINPHDQGGKMLFFVFGLLLGGLLGVFLIAMLTKSNKDDESISRSMEEKDRARILKEGPNENIYH